MITLGIDPGISGALSVIINGVPTAVYDLPTIKAKSKTIIDSFRLQMLIYGIAPNRAVIEQVGASPQMGVSGAFNFGHTAGIIAGVCAGCEIPVEMITPQKWKGVFGFLKKEKDVVRLKAIEEFPRLASDLKRKKDCDRADAIYIALAWEKLDGHKGNQGKAGGFRIFDHGLDK